MSNRHSGNLGEYEYFWHCTPQTIYNAQSKYATSNAIIIAKIMPPTRHMRSVLFENWNVMPLIFCILNRIVQKPCKALIYRCVWRTMIEPIFQFKKKAKKDHIVKNWGLTNGRNVFGCFGCCQGLVWSISVEWIGTSAGLDKPSPSLVYTRGALITTPFHCVQLSPDYWCFVNCLQW